MGWNYRVFRDLADEFGGERTEYFTVGEAYYEGDEVKGWALSCHPLGETKEDPAEDVAKFVRALSLPVLDVSSGKAVEVDSGPTE